MITELKSEVEKHFARKITNRGDCEALAQDIYEKTGAVLSYNTIRRIYGLAAYRKPRASTLDQLAAYCGFDSFIEFWLVFKAKFNKANQNFINGLAKNLSANL